MLEQLLRPGELDRAGEPHIVVRRLRGALLDHAEPEARGHAVEPLEARVVGQERDPRFHVHDARCIEQRGNHEGCTGMRRADLVLDQGLGEGRAQLGRQRQRGILVH